MVCPERKALAETYAAAVEEYRRIVTSLLLKDGRTNFKKALAGTDEARHECERRRRLLNLHVEEHGCY
jgi:hypothetical protein